MQSFRARSRADAGWFSAGLASSFPDLGTDDGNLSDLRFCDADLKPGCKVFHAPKPQGNAPPQSSELEVASDGAGFSELEGDLKDQVMVFKFRGKFHAVDHVSLFPNPTHTVLSLTMLVEMSALVVSAVAGDAV